MTGSYHVTARSLLVLFISIFKLYEGSAQDKALSKTSLGLDVPWRGQTAKVREGGGEGRRGRQGKEAREGWKT